MHDFRYQLIKNFEQCENIPTALKLLVSDVKSLTDADCCSLYVLNYRTGNFVFMATDGLSSQAEGVLELSPSQGVVGFISQRLEHLKLKDSRQHPAYIKVPDLGEERCRAYLGVPIIQRRRVIGILVIQRFTKKIFTEEIEARMLTIAVQLSENIASIALEKLLRPEEYAVSTKYWQASPVSPGLAIGKGVIGFDQNHQNEIDLSPCDDPEKEIKRFREAIIATRKEIHALSDKLKDVVGEKEIAMFGAYENMIMDASMANEVEQKILLGNGAAASLQKVIKKYISQLLQVDDPYLRERTDDLHDLARRILNYLQQTAPKQIELVEKSIVIAKEVTATMLAELPRDKVIGIVSLKGSATSHAAILASALGIPAVFSVANAKLEDFANVDIVVDGYTGHVVCSPEKEVLQHYQLLQQSELIQEQQQLQATNNPAVTPDGYKVDLLLNIGMGLDWELKNDVGAEGVGLYRTEIAFMLKQRFPGEEEQEKIYSEVLKQMKGKPVVIRTLDIGGDKALSYFPIHDKNPFLGWRGIRVSLDHPELFLVQLRALIKAHQKYKNLHIAFPMIAHVAELDESLKLFEQAFKEVEEESSKLFTKFVKPKVGIVLEVPSAVYQIRALAQRVDFISIGSNDLTQYLLALDRNNSRVSHRFDSLHPAVLQAIKIIVEGAKASNIPVQICGEMASDPLGAALLLALEVDGMSMNASSISRIRELVRALNLSDAKQLLENALSKENSEDVRFYLQQKFETLGLGGLIRAGS
jgi:phosphotransferase system enzyme I (PtsP)